MEPQSAVRWVAACRVYYVIRNRLSPQFTQTDVDMDVGNPCSYQEQGIVKELNNPQIDTEENSYIST